MWVNQAAEPARDYLSPLHWTTMVPATTSYTVLLCWKKRRVMKTGKRKAMEKFLLSARTVDLQKRTWLWPDSLRQDHRDFTVSCRWFCHHSRWEGDAGCRNNQNPIGSDQRGCVTRHHSQAEQKLPWRGAAGAPDAERLIGRQHLLPSDCSV